MQRNSESQLQPKRVTRTSNTSGAIPFPKFCRPLAILPQLLLGPVRLTPRASAQTLLCTPNQVVNTCSIPSTFEPNAVTAFLQAHGIPASDSQLAYQYGRADLRNELRADLFANVLAIIRKNPTTRTSDEQHIYNWLQGVVWQHEQDQLSAAIADRNAWEAHPCTWTPDPVTAQQYNLNYDGSLWCGAGNNPLATLFTIAPPVPSKDYFLTAALAKTYGQILGSTPSGAAVLGGTIRNYLAAAGVAAGGGLAVAGGVGGFGIALQLTGQLQHLVVEQVTEGVSEAAIQEGVEITEESVLEGGDICPPCLIVTAGVLIGAIATFEVFEQQETLNGLATLDSDYKWTLANKPLLESFVNNQVGLYKLQASFLENTLRDTPSTAVPPGRQSGDRNLIVTPMGGTPAVNPTFTYLDWAGTQWTAQPSGGWISAQGVKKDGTTDYNFGVSIKFKGWDGKLYNADRNDLHFTVSKFIPLSTDTAYCAPDSSGNTPPDVSKCATYVTDTLNLLDANGNKVAVQFTGFPLFTSPSTLPADLTTTTKLSVTADGNPLPTITLNSALPNGWSFSATTPGHAQITIPQDLTGTTAGSYNLTFTADNGGGSPATQTLTVIANVQVQILGTANPVDPMLGIGYNVYAGQPFSQLIVVAGSPKPTLTCTGNTTFQASGAVFKDNLDGTGTLSGTMAPASLGLGNIVANPIPIQCTLYADNQVTNDSKLVMIYGIVPPAATITSPTTATWVDNDTNELRVTATVPSGPLGTPKVSFSFPCGQPPWMTFKDNGDGTAVLSGRPPFPTTLVPLLLFAAAGEVESCAIGINPDGSTANRPPNITINIQHIPVLPDPMYQFMTAGVPIITTISASLPAGGNGTVTGTPPPGVQFTAGPLSSWQLTGTPPVGSGGEYDMLYTASAPTGTASGIFQLFVLQPPQIVSLNSVTFRTGQNNSFDVNTTGFPKLAIPGLRDAMQITLQGTLPQGVVFTNTNPVGVPTGTAVFSGSTTALGTYPLTLTASNGVGSNFIQNFTLVVALPGDANLDGVVNCADLDLVGASFGYYRGQPNYNANADLNNDGVVNWADVTIVESNLPAGNSCVFAMGFATMSAGVIAIGNTGNFTLTSAFTLNPDSDGINPATEAFSLQVGGFSVTVPAGSFKQLQSGAKKGSWVYAGTISGVSLSVQIQPSGANSFVLNASASGSGLSPLPKPVQVRIRIGDDGGTISVVPTKN
jgi:hypothetical protein